MPGGGSENSALPGCDCAMSTAGRIGSSARAAHRPSLANSDLAPEATVGVMAEFALSPVELLLCSLPAGAHGGRGGSWAKGTMGVHDRVIER
jgi:hypothetical protein